MGERGEFRVNKMNKSCDKLSVNTSSLFTICKTDENLTLLAIRFSLYTFISKC